MLTDVIIDQGQKEILWNNLDNDNSDRVWPYTISSQTSSSIKLSPGRAQGPVLTLVSWDSEPVEWSETDTNIREDLEHFIVYVEVKIRMVYVKCMKFNQNPTQLYHPIVLAKNWKAVNKNCRTFSEKTKSKCLLIWNLEATGNHVASGQTWEELPMETPG